MINSVTRTYRYKMQAEKADTDDYPDVFTKILDDEGLLKYSNPMNKMPVLSVCYDFLDAELSAISWSYVDEKRYKASFQHLDQEKQESYIRLFSSQYPMEPLVDGLPESVWLECVEPTLNILKALNILKRRKSNLSVRRSSMSKVDNGVACHGDVESGPFIFNPFLRGQRLRMMRVQFLALEGVHDRQEVLGGNDQDDIQELPEGGYPALPTVQHRDAQRRRRARQYRPYDVLRDMLRNSDQLNNNASELAEMA